MNPFSTLRARFALWVAGLLLAALLVFGAFVYSNLARSLRTNVDDSLQLSAAQAIAAMNIEDGEIAIADTIPETSALVALRERGFTIRVLRPDGTVLQTIGPYHNLQTPASQIADAVRRAPTFATITLPASSDIGRVYTAPIIDNGRIIGLVQVARTLEDIQDTLQQLLAALLISIPLLVCGAAVGGYVLAARALAPIDQITRTARRISAEDLHARLKLPPTDDEVGRLAATFDTMLARLEAAFEHERQFTADASHELRTPLAAMQAILGVIRTQRRTPEAYEQALDDLADETNRLRALADDLLHLARDDSHALSAYRPVALSVLLQDVADSLAPLAEARGLTLRCQVTPGLQIMGDQDGLIRLFVNLIDNAVKYTDSGSVTVCAERARAGVQVRIIDTGIGIDAAHLPRVFDRFYRVEAARSTYGTGLGLAIAHTIVRIHAGTITLDSAPGCGTTCRVVLPATQ